MSSDFNQIIGHKKQLSYLKKVIENGNAGHAYCFSGPGSIGKYTIARYFIAQILKINESRLEVHPNVSIINDEKISVDSIRELRERLTLSTLGGGTKVAIINSAHTMSHSAQNALLKTLEEPSGKTIIILVTEKPEYLLQTILSRSAHIKFNLVPTLEIKNEMAYLCARRPGLAIKLMNEEFKHDFLELSGEAEEFLKMSLAKRLTYVESVVRQKDERNDKIKELISVWRILIHRNLLKSLDANNVKIAKSHTAQLRALQETEEALNSNSNKSLALQHFALSF